MYPVVQKGCETVCQPLHFGQHLCKQTPFLLILPLTPSTTADCTAALSFICVETKMTNLIFVLKFA